MKRLIILLMPICLMPVGGCASMAAATVESIIFNALGIDDEDDEHDFERQREQERKLKLERKWIQHWRDNPEEIPAMTEAFKDDYR